MQISSPGLFTVAKLVGCSPEELTLALSIKRLDINILVIILIGLQSQLQSLPGSPPKAIASNGVNESIGIYDESRICHASTEIQLLCRCRKAVKRIIMMSELVHNPFRLIGVGLSIWTFATAGCGSSFNLWSIAICRMLVGVGEASFISLAAPFIDDHVPADQVGESINWR
ncbi:putative major facilitator superfamily domain-containing protein [Rosa chinensis]|uniref:Putative major facilitator superfamily domain-containing protein n=1 Tax=Rosa chinensis TaxID=74649 RepID=A0A2P6PS49_ROSCH|nr:putative major facilitator superfamily domain-containing protein [Rosa chinensis]